MYALIMLVGVMVVALTMLPIGQTILDRYGMVGVGVTVGIAAGLVFFIRELLAEGFANWLFGSERKKLDSRRKMMKHSGRVSAAESKLEALSDAELAAKLEDDPRDALALEIHCERLKKAGRAEDYARELEYLLTIPNEFTTEEKATRRHELADLYLGPLAQPRRAREALEALIAELPRSYQATLARRRLDEMDSNPPE